MNEYKICDHCSGENFEKLVERINEIDETAIFNIGCQNMCALGAQKLFVILNGMLLFSENLDELIEQIKEKKN